MSGKPRASFQVVKNTLLLKKVFMKFEYITCSKPVYWFQNKCQNNRPVRNVFKFMDVSSAKPSDQPFRRPYAYDVIISLRPHFGDIGLHVNAGVGDVPATDHKRVQDSGFCPQHGSIRSIHLLLSMWFLTSISVAGIHFAYISCCYVEQALQALRSSWQPLLSEYAWTLNKRVWYFICACVS